MRPMDEALDRVGLLAEPVRRAISLHVAASPSPLSRDEVAAAVGIGRPLATFHLERLAAAGLLDTSPAPPPRRTRPRARPPPGPPRPRRRAPREAVPARQGRGRRVRARPPLRDARRRPRRRD